MRDLSLHLLDIVQNSVKANARRIKIGISADVQRGRLEITVEDDGSGMDEELLRQVDNPFVTTRTTRKVGMGIPLFKASARRASGDLEIWSEKGCGTTVKACFDINHIDRPPLGNLGETAVGMILTNPDIRYEMVLSNTVNSFEFDSFEIKKKLDGVPITEYEVLMWIREYIDEGVKAIFGGVLNEINS